MPRPSPHVYRRLLSTVRPYRGQVALGVGASLVAAAAAAAYAYSVGPLLEAVLLERPLTLGPWTLEGKRLLWGLPLLLVAVASLKAAAQVAQTGLMFSVGQHVITDLRRGLYDRLLLLPPAFFERRHSGELLGTFTSDVAQVDFAVTQALSSYVRDTLQILALLTTCWLIDPQLFGIAFVALPLAILPLSRFAKSVKRLARRTQGSLGKLGELGAEQLQNLAVVQAYRAEGELLRRLDVEQARYLSVMTRSILVRGAFTPALELLGIVGVAAAIAFGAQAVAAEPALAGRLLSFLGAALLIYKPLKALSGTWSNVQHGLGAAERLFELSDAPVPPEAEAVAGPLRNALSLRDVQLSYGEGEHAKPALRGLTLEIRAGQRVALVGPSGGGKSTVLSLVLGFVRAQGGAVTWDGTSLDSLSRASVRAQLAWVPQEPVLFSGTLRDNLRMARPDATEAELWAALEGAHSDAFVRAFPSGLDEDVGERGSRLSGGQRQRLAVARALLRRPSLLLLDEPTSALDAESERAVQEGLARLMQGRTVLCIAHRLSTVRAFDLICVVEDGAVVEQGTHEALLARGGRYAQLLAARAVA